MAQAISRAHVAQSRNAPSRQVFGDRNLPAVHPSPATVRGAVCNGFRDPRNSRGSRDSGSSRRAKFYSKYFGDVNVDAPLTKPKGDQDTKDLTKRSKDRYDSDFIWNSGWLEQESNRIQSELKAQSEEKGHVPEQAGRISLSRVADLDDINVDLSERLRQKPKPLVPKGIPANAMNLRPSTRTKSDLRTTSYAFTKSTPRQSSAEGTIEDVEPAESYNKEQQAKLARQKYEADKQEYKLWTTALTVVCFSVVYSLYTKDVAASYLIGALGGIFYLRLLVRSVDSIGAMTLDAASGGVGGQTRFLVPVILVLAYNRYNMLYSESLGIELQLFPMLAGFFTYKIAVLGTSFKEMLLQWGVSDKARM